MKLRSIQVMRGVAATAVVVHHAVPGQIAEVGSAGVDLFFVISGFIMATVAADKRPGQFLFDRFWRIYPVWIIALLPWLFLRPHGVGQIIASATLWPFYGTYPILGVGWSLTFEVLFYAGFALALATRAWVPLLIFAACLPFCDSSHSVVWQTGSPIIIEFLAGVVIARCRTNEVLGGAMLVIGIAWLLLAPVDHSQIAGGSAAFARLAYWGVPAGLIVYGALSLERWFAHRAFDFAVFLGDASYSIYLFHQLVAHLSPWPVGLAAGMGVGVFAHLAFERPILRAKPQLGHFDLPDEAAIFGKAAARPDKVGAIRAGLITNCGARDPGVSHEGIAGSGPHLHRDDYVVGAVIVEGE